MDRKLIRKLINNIYSEAQYIDTQMELRDRKEPDSAIALTQEENTEIMIMLSQADYLKDYLHNSIDVKATKEKKEKWIVHEWAEEEKGYLIDNYECSKCGSWSKYKTNFCPNCGTRLMKG